MEANNPNVPLAFIDTETTGVHPGRLAWEVAVIRREPDGNEWTTVFQIEDVDLSNADPFGLKVGGFYERYYRYRADDVMPIVLSEKAAASEVEIATRGAHLVGAVPNFDAEVFDAMLRRHKLIPAWHYHLIDVEALAVGYLHGQALNANPAPALPWRDLPWRSDDLSRACGVEPASDKDRHTALGDAKWAMRLYDAIVGVAR